MASSTPENTYKVVSSLDPVAVTASQTSLAGTDTLGFEFVTVVVSCGVLTGDWTLDVKLQDSADNSTFADISGAALTQFTSSHDSGVYMARIRTAMIDRYIRPHITVAGTTPVAPFAVSFILSGADVSNKADNSYDFTL